MSESSCVSPHISEDVGLVEGLEVNGLDDDGRDESDDVYSPTDPGGEELVEDDDELLDGQDEEKHNEEDFIGRDEAPEEAPLKRPNNPSDPTPKEREEHNAKHLPYRPWCQCALKRKEEKILTMQALPKKGMKDCQRCASTTPRRARMKT